MPFDGIVTKSIVDELTRELVGGRVEKVFQPESDEIVLLVRARNKSHRLVMSASPNYPRIHMTEAVKENPQSPPVFCMLLRKHLNSGRILSFEINDYERIIGLIIEATNELGDISEKKLVIEIMGRHSNIILLNNDNKIIDSIKHIDSDISSVREVMPARPYILPPAQGKLSPAAIDTSALLQELGASNKTVDKFLLDNIKGFSPLLCREVCFRAGIGNRTGAASLAEDARLSLKKALDCVLYEIKQDKYEPCIMFEDEYHQKPLDFHCLAIGQYKYRRSLDSISLVLDTFYSTRDKAERLRQQKSDLNRVLGNSIDRCNKKLAIQEDTLRDVAGRENLRLYGELITANIYAIPKNAERVSLLNYYSDSGEEYIDIPLNPNLLPQENAQRYYKKYAKAKNAFVYTSRQLKDSQRELEYLEGVLALLDNCTTLREIDEVRQELSEQGYMKLKKKRLSKKQEKMSDPLHFTSSDGFDIFVGKNNKHNDYLTLKFAQSNDIWFHAKNIPGSHVIIKKQGREIPDRTLEEAAILAAWHSKARMSPKVQVDYTTIKNVSKPSGAKPGMVIYANYKTALVTPDKAIVDRLTVQV